MEQWRKDARKEPIIIDIDSLVPADHLLRKIEKVMDYEWLYERLDARAAVGYTTEYRKDFSKAGECDRMVAKEVIKL